MNPDRRLEIGRGDGTVVAVPGIALLAVGDDPPESLVEIVRAAAETQPPGRDLARRLAGLLTGDHADRVPAFGAVAEVDGGLLVFLYGSVDATAVHDDGTALRLAGSDATTWVDRVLGLDHRVVTIASEADPVSDETPFEVTSGIVPAGWLRVIVPSSAQAQAGLRAETPQAPAGATPVEPAEPAGETPVEPAEPAEEVPVAEEAPVAKVAPVAEVAPTPIPPPRPVDQPLDPVAESTSPLPEPEAAAQSSTTEPTVEPAEPETAPVTPPPIPPPPGAHAADAPSADAPAADAPSPEAATAQAETDDPPTEALPVAFESFSLTPDRGTFRAPLPADREDPTGGTAGSDGDDAEVPERKMVQGIMCSRQHFNSPDSAFCSSCGISMVHATHNLVRRERPPLGFLVFDDGSTFTLDDRYVLGREPESDPLVQSEQARPIALEDAQMSVSRVHAEIQLIGWDVQLLDRGSTNGTHLLNERGDGWDRLPPQQPRMVAPGSRVAVGQRTFVYESPQRG